MNGRQRIGALVKEAVLLNIPSNALAVGRLDNARLEGGNETAVGIGVVIDVVKGRVVGRGMRVDLGDVQVALVKVGIAALVLVSADVVMAEPVVETFSLTTELFFSVSCVSVIFLLAAARFFRAR